MSFFMSQGLLHIPCGALSLVSSLSFFTLSHAIRTVRHSFFLCTNDISAAINTNEYHVGNT